MVIWYLSLNANLACVRCKIFHKKVTYYTQILYPSLVSYVHEKVGLQCHVLHDLNFSADAYQLYRHLKLKKIFSRKKIFKILDIYSKKKISHENIIYTSTTTFWNCLLLYMEILPLDSTVRIVYMVLWQSNKIPLVIKRPINCTMYKCSYFDLV